MTRDIVKKTTKKIKSQIRSPVREDNQMNKNRKENYITRTKVKIEIDWR
jgi:hypothetical protein